MDGAKACAVVDGIRSDVLGLQIGDEITAVSFCRRKTRSRGFCGGAWVFRFDGMWSNGRPVMSSPCRVSGLLGPRPPPELAAPLSTAPAGPFPTPVAADPPLPAPAARSSLLPEVSWVMSSAAAGVPSRRASSAACSCERALNSGERVAFCENMLAR